MSAITDFEIENGVLKRYNGPGGDVTVPDGVTSIDYRAFYHCSSLTSIMIPDSVTSIGDWAFSYCMSLTSITIPDGVMSISKEAFEYCRSLRSITIPESVTSIGGGAFEDCSSLTSITIPESVTSIGDYAFKGCSSLTSITIPESVTSIGKEAFEGCSSLTSITIPDGVTSIGYNAFRACENLTRITLPNSLTSIDCGAFFLCSSLTSITIPEGVTSIGDWAFKDCSSLRSITIPESVTSIGEYVFCECKRLTSIMIPESVTSIGRGAFECCEKLKSITIPDSVTSVGSHVFYECKSLTSITIPEGVTSIGKETFSYCSSLTSVTIPESVTSIGNGAFSDCKSLTSLTIPESVTSIGNEAFDGCKELADADGFVVVRGILYSYHGPGGDAVIPDGVTSIGGGAFEDCSSLTSITIPESVTSIGDSAFEDCRSLKSIMLPNRLTKVGDEVFYGCCKLSEVNINSDNLKFPPKTFENYHSLAASCMNLFPHLTDGNIKELFLSPEDWRKIDPDAQFKLYCSRQSKTLSTGYLSCMSKDDVERFGRMLLEKLAAKPSAKDFTAAANLCIHFPGDLPEETVKGIYAALKSRKGAEKAAKSMETDEVLASLLNAELSNEISLPPAERIVSDCLKRQGVLRRELEARLKEYYSLTPKELPEIRYESGEAASPIVLIWLLTAHEIIEEEKIGWNYIEKTLIAGYKQPGVCDEAKEVLTSIDAESLQDALRTLGRNYLGSVGYSKKMYLAYPICRYADEETMAALTKEAPKWRSTVSGINAPPLRTFRAASLYSNTRSAMLFAERYHELDRYAQLRGTDEDTLRNMYLSDVGLDEDGGKRYDLGNMTVTARLQEDLSFLIEVPGTDKPAKSLPKKNADPEKYDAANTDFSRLKKDAKRIIKSRATKLFEDFLSGKETPSAMWQDAYLKNPLLRHIGKLVVWSQGEESFILTDGGPVRSDGSEYEIKSDVNIKVAHPMEIGAEAADAWQHYLNSRGIKQPFAQVWEPVVDMDSCTEDRYSGIEIPYYRFRSMEKHGIYADFDIGESQASIVFADCIADIRELDWNRHMIFNEDRFVIDSISFIRTRQANHILAYLDKITVFGRILKDDVTVEPLLSSFTLAQIMEFITLATENNCPNVAALLLQYRQTHFAEFNPMDEFTLDLL